MIGMQNLLRGYTVKVWKGADFSQTKYYNLNKKLVKYYVLHCAKY